MGQGGPAEVVVEGWVRVSMEVRMGEASVAGVSPVRAA